ncbi:MAG: hypothetical protein V5A34_06505, partial [Halapricum sp.]
MTDLSLSREQWGRLFDAIDAEAPPALEVAERLADADETSDTDDPEETDENHPEEPDSPGSNPTPDDEKTGSRPGKTPGVQCWGEVDFSDTTRDTYPPELLDVEQWMGRLDGKKMPFSPWADRDYPEADPDDDARYKWGLRENYADGDTVAMAEDDPRLDGRVFIQREEDPYAFVDGDDVRDPETGEVHPAFVAILEHLGVTYADVSTSGAGVHAYYRGEIPLDGVPQAAFDIDTEPWGANDDPPAVEIYPNKHVNVTTGDHIVGTGTRIAEWNSDALESILRAQGLDDKPEPAADQDLDLEDHDPAATEADETTDDIKDIIYAIDRLDARRVAADTIVHTWNDSASTSGENRAFAPTWGPNANGTANIVNREIWQDTGGMGYGGPVVMAAIDCSDLPSYDERTQPSDVRGADWFRAVDHLRELGYAVPELEDPEDTDGETYRRDPTEAEVVLEPKRAWDAANAVEPGDLDDQPLETDGDVWIEPGTGREVPDVVRAVAIAEYPDADVESPLADRYADAYRTARDHYGAPLPEYLTQGDAVERFDYVLGAVRELTYWHLDEEALTVTVTGEDGDVAGDAVRTLDPSPVAGWRDSESGASVLVFPSGTVYDADLGEDGRVIDTLRFVAVDAGVLTDPTDPLEGEDFTEAYRIAREQYGAPLPRWNAGTPDVTPVLPPAEDLVDEPDPVDRERDRLDDLRGETEALYREAISEPETVDVLNVLPALGKTTAAIKTAADRPTTYLAPRKELMEQAAAKASNHGASYQHLPVFSEANLDQAFVDYGVDAVRDRGKDLLRNRWELLDAVGATGNGEIYDEEDETDSDTVDLDRATCPTAEGDHGDAWALAVHVARALDYTPRDIHERAEALFGTALPCQDEGEGHTCDYTDGWDAVSDPDQPIDLLIGHYAHAHVESARTYYKRAGNGNVRKSARAVVLDEFVGRSFTETFGEDALEHAVWLASALSEDVDDRQDLLERDVWSDELVRSWLEGEAGEEGGPTYGLVTSLRARERALSAAATAAEVLEGREDVLKNHGLYDPLTRVRDGVLDLSSEERASIAGTIQTTADTVEPGAGGFRVIQWASDEVAGPLAESTEFDLAVDPDQLPDGELRTFVEQAVESGEPGVLRAAATALSGGDDGARELSVFADDGYAHRKAHYLLEAAIRPPQERDNPKIPTEAFT